MAEGPGLLTRIRSALALPAPRGPEPRARGDGSGPIMPLADGAIPPSYPANWWQRALPTGGGGESATVNACVNAYAQTIAQLPGGHFRENDKGKPDRIKTSALSRILRSPNDYQTRSDFMTNAVSDIMFSGNAYAFASRNDRQEVAALHLMPAKGTMPYVEPESGAIFYGLGTNPMLGQIDYLVPQRDVLHLRGRCKPGEPLRGISPLSWALSAQAANIAITGTQAAFFSNASQPSGVLSAESPLTKEQMTRLREAWREQSAGVASGQVPVLGGGLKWVPMGINAQDAQLVEAFGMTVADIARAFGVPLPIIGDLSASTFNNTEQLIGLWLSTGLGYWVEAIEIAFDKFFGLPLGEFTELDTDTLLRTQFKDRIDGLTKGIIGGLYSPNEARRKEGLGDVKFGDEPRVQAQVVPLSQIDKQPAAPTPAAPGNPIAPGDAPPGSANDNAPPKPAPDAAAKMIEAVAAIANDSREANRELILAIPEIVRALIPPPMPPPMPPPDAPKPEPIEPAPTLERVDTRQDMAARELVFAFQMSDGSAHETRAPMLPGFLPSDYAARGWKAIRGDIVRVGEIERTALVDNPRPNVSADWADREIRGRRGRDGKPGAIIRAPESPLEIDVTPQAAIPPDELAPPEGEHEPGSEEQD
jgi:HK97 family phage portal protein